MSRRLRQPPGIERPAAALSRPGPRRFPSRSRQWLLAGAVVLLAACAGPPTSDQPLPLPDAGLTGSERFSAAPYAPAPSEADTRWWHRFGDPALAAWVDAALAANLDVAVARERVAQAEAVLARTEAVRRPLLGADLQFDASSRRGNGGSRTDLSAGLGLSWAPDLWGGQRQAERSAAAAVLRSADLVQATRLATAGLSARTYLALREALEEQRLLDEGLALQRDILRIVQVRFDAGLAPRLDLDRAQADAAATEADLAAAASRIRQFELALQVLVGQRPGSPFRVPVAGSAAGPARSTSPSVEVPGDGPNVEAPGSVRALPRLDGPLGVPRPVDLLRLRPDVRAAERVLIGAVADVGVARAAFYPRLQLPGQLVASGLGSGGAALLTATLGALLDVTLYDGGQRQANLDAFRSLAREAALLYERSVLDALQQAETALAIERAVATQAEARERADRSAASAVEQARLLYTQGLSGFIDVLEAQRTMLQNRLALMRVQVESARASVAVFEALGMIDEPEAGH